VFRVRDGEGLTSGAGEVDRLALDSFDIRVDRPGAILVRIHWSSNFRVVRGDACIAPSEEGWTRVVAADAGTVRVHAGMDLDRTLETGTQQCTARSAR
jgi:hypothetical protein